MKLFDANAILRFLLNDIKEQAAEVAQAIRGGAITTPEVLAEVVYVLSGLYGMPRNEVSWALHCVLIDVKVENARALRYALGVFNRTSLDFVDCLLIAYHKVNGIDVLSFDKKLNTTLDKDLEIYQPDMPMIQN